MALKEHKRGCKCVACSPATRRRGMLALRKSGLKKIRHGLKHKTPEGAKFLLKMFKAKAKAKNKKNF